MEGKKAFSSNHASKIVGSGFPTNQNGLATFLSSLYGIVGGEYSFTNSSTKEEAVQRVDPEQLDQLLHPQFDVKADYDVVAKGLNASPGAAVGELDVAHITEMVFEDGEYLFELTTSLFKARSFLELCNGAGVTNTGNNVFALCVNKVVAVEFLFAICGVTRKSNARSRSVALVAENHGLNVYGST